MTSGHKALATVDLDRTDFTNVTPAVLVESPTPGASVASPLKVSGIANTFEAVVSYTIADGDGLIVDERDTTASAGTAVWGDFEFTSTFENTKPDLIQLGKLLVELLHPRHLTVHDYPPTTVYC